MKDGHIFSEESEVVLFRLGSLRKRRVTEMRETEHD